MIKDLKKTFTQFMSILLIAMVISCEDDPILEPQSNDEPAGSYGLLLMDEDEIENDENPETFEKT